MNIFLKMAVIVVITISLIPASNVLATTFGTKHSYSFK